MGTWFRWLLVAGFFVTGSLATLQAAEPFAEPWQSEYTGKHASGPQVIGLWQFTTGRETQDSSTRLPKGELNGAQIHAAGKFGSCLESFPGFPIVDKRHALVVPNTRALSPTGAFTLELWIQPKPEFTAAVQAFLIDKKYVAHTDYQLIIGPASKQGLRTLQLSLGFGEDSITAYSEPQEFTPGKWTHLACTYDGAGHVGFVRDGRAIGERSYSGRGSITPGTRPLSIGDRLGSNYRGFPGYIDEVRLTKGVREFRPIRVTADHGRRTFLRHESAPPLQLRIRNLLQQELTGIEVQTELGGESSPKTKIPALKSGAEHLLTIPVNTQLRPDTYELRVHVTAGGSIDDTNVQSIPLTIVARPLPHRMPVVMWGLGGVEGVLRELPRLKDLGFTHCLGLEVGYDRIWKAGQPTAVAKPERIIETQQMLDAALAGDLSIVVSLSPGRWARDLKQFQRVNRAGQPYKTHDVDGLYPEIQQFCENVGTSVAQAYAAYPAFQSALIHTEVRGESQLSFNDIDREAYRKFSGQEIPAEVLIKNGVQYGKLKNFPASRIIPDNDPILRFYQWFWKVGDGWNGLHTAVQRGLKSTDREDFWTFHDPAVRVPSIYGNGGQVDVLSQWTYSYPDPIRLAMPTDELFAMAAGAASPQRVMKMTQIIWYRSQTAPPKSGSKTSATTEPSVWEDTDPDAAFITISPMHLREAFWTKIARPIQGIMYHGWQSLVPTNSPGGYRYTHPETQHELRRLVKTVVEPLGPTLLQVPASRGDVAFLESFASQMLARRGAYGWSHTWSGSVYEILHYAQLQPEVVYDETILQQGLDGYKVLVLADCDVLSQGVADRIVAFQKAGGIVVGDDRLAPGIRPDIRLTSFNRPKEGDQAKAMLLDAAAKLRTDLGNRYTRPLDSSNPEIVTHLRRQKNADYVFVVNDHREFGDYVGQHGLVMENGLPSEGAISLRRSNGTVYDLTTSRQVTAKASQGWLEIPVALGPCDGRVYLVTDRPINGVKIDTAKTAMRGGDLNCEIAVTGDDGQPIDAVVPVQVEIRDPDGRLAEFSGYYGAVHGRLTLRLNVAPNDTLGVWQISVKELASGRTAAQYVRVGK